MRTATRATHHTYTLRVDVLAVLEHPVQENVATGCLIDMGATTMMVAYFFLTLSPSVEVEVYADGTHAGEGAQSLLLILAIAVGPVSVGTNDQSVLLIFYFFFFI